MRILAVIDSFGLGGAETQLATALTFLAEERKHECLACSLHPPPPREVVFGPSIQKRYLGKRSRFSLPLVLVRLASLVRQVRPDVVYSRLPLSNALTALGTRLAGYSVRHVAGIDTVPAMFTRSYVLKHPGVVLFRWLEKFANQIVCNSESTARLVIEDGYPAHRISVVPNGINFESFRPPGARSSTTPTRLVCVASLRPEKGVQHLLRLLAPILRDGLARLTLVGDGPERRRVIEAIQQLHLEAAVSWLGEMDDVAGVLQDSDLYVSAAEVEGFGIAVAEAAATGIPSVCLDSPGGLAEVVANSITGYLIPPEREDLFREAVRGLCEDSELRLRMGEAARRRVIERFDIAEVAAQLERTFLVS